VTIVLALPRCGRVNSGDQYSELLESLEI